MVVAPGELTSFVDLVVTSPLICVVHSRDGLDWPLARAIAEKNGVPGESALADLRFM